MVVIRLARKGWAEQNSAYGSLRSFIFEKLLLTGAPHLLEAVRHRIADEVLKKLYYANASRLMPGLSHADFTN